MGVPPSQWHDSFLAAIAQRVSGPLSPSFNPRCLSEHRFFALLDEVAADGVRLRYPKRQLTDWLESVGLLRPIRVENANPRGGRRVRLYSLQLGAQAGSAPTAPELLQAYDPQGVICYATAIQIHGLSAQIPPHHHVAVISPSPKRSPRQSSVQEREAVRAAANPLGTRMFSYGGMDYYRTVRDGSLLPGVQQRYLSPTTVARVTTLEQTLLDTLHRPLSCGGPAVVFEAWQEGIARINEKRLMEYLALMRHSPTLQRLGYLLEYLEYNPDSHLMDLLRSHARSLPQSDPAACHQLIAGITHERLHPFWLVYGP